MIARCDAIARENGAQCKITSPDVYQLGAEDGPLVRLCHMHSQRIMVRRRLIRRRGSQMATRWVEVE